MNLQPETIGKEGLYHQAHLVLCRIAFRHSLISKLSVETHFGTRAGMDSIVSRDGTRFQAVSM